jgi:hypothetical protein
MANALPAKLLHVAEQYEPQIKALPGGLRRGQPCKGEWMFYDNQRLHQAPGMKTPAEAFAFAA